MNKTDIRKKTLFINSRSPYGSSYGQEAQEMLLAASAFNHTISIIFMDDGVLQLKNQQNPEEIKLKNYTLAYKALHMYDINNIYVVNDSLRQRGLKPSDLLLPVKLIETTEIRKIFSTQDFIFNF